MTPMRTRTLIRLAIHAVALLAMAALYLASFRAHAAGLCVDVAVPKAAIAARGGRWMELTRDQWQFLRGVYVLNPNTGAGLPYGQGAALASVDGKEGGLAFFIDGPLACTPMALPRVLVEMLNDVGASRIKHEGTEN